MDRFLGVNIWHDTTNDICEAIAFDGTGDGTLFELRRVYPHGWVVCTPRGTVVATGESESKGREALTLIVRLVKDGDA